MFTKSHFSFGLIVVTVAIAVLGGKRAEAAEPQVPVVDLASFTPGASWTWQYFENDALYSTEKYTVLSHDAADLVWLEMSTMFPGETEFHAHNRLAVPVHRCLAAYASTVPKAWSFEMYNWNGGAWEKTDVSSTLAFEEKFNCNPHVYPDAYPQGSPEYVTRFQADSSGELFSQERWGRVSSSWFFASGPLAGIAARKSFPKAAGQPVYVFKLQR